MAGYTQRLKIVLLGDDGVGKTSFMQRYARREFLTHYEPSLQAKLYSMYIQFNEGLIIFDIWDIPPRIPCDNLIRDSDGAILMFDNMNPSTYESIPRYYSTMLPIFDCEDRLPIPVVMCGNRCENTNRRVNPQTVTFHREKGLQYYDFSVRCLYNFHKPLLFLARRLLSDPYMDYQSYPDVGGALERERSG
ncbi:P-loop containing nucleoside triphosphate hydrolase protein [Aspergillus cavernicola]|uniref:P-loop containing nucleoside triphosphate hydrolase protein n=1 Tax=Aspergillus cavernicola TaxID=176166 RepID=A0ABR4IA52_9EURO